MWRRRLSSVWYFSCFIIIGVMKSYMIVRNKTRLMMHSANCVVRYEKFAFIDHIPVIWFRITLIYSKNNKQNTSKDFIIRFQIIYLTTDKDSHNSDRVKSNFADDKFEWEFHVWDSSLFKINMCFIPNATLVLIKMFIWMGCASRLIVDEWQIFDNFSFFHSILHFSYYQLPMLAKKPKKSSFNSEVWCHFKCYLTLQDKEYSNNLSVRL